MSTILIDYEISHTARSRTSCFVELELDIKAYLPSTERHGIAFKCLQAERQTVHICNIEILEVQKVPTLFSHK